VGAIGEKWLRHCHADAAGVGKDYDSAPTRTSTDGVADVAFGLSDCRVFVYRTGKRTARSDALADAERQLPPHSSD